MDAYPLLSDAIRAAWMQPAMFATTAAAPPQSAPATGAAATTAQHASVGPAATSPLDHIQAIAQWYGQSKERVARYHADAPILASRGQLLGGGGAGHRHGATTAFAMGHPTAQTPAVHRHRGSSPLDHTPPGDHSSSISLRDDDASESEAEDGLDAGFEDEGSDDEAFRLRRSIVLPRRSADE